MGQDELETTPEETTCGGLGKEVLSCYQCRGDLEAS